MGIFQRMSDIVKSNINFLLDKAENPRLLINQLILDMDLDYQQALNQLKRTLVDEKKMELEIRRNENAMAEWQNKAEFALVKNREDLAREALKRKNEINKILKSLNHHYAEHQRTIEEHKTILDAFRAKISEAKEKREELLNKLKHIERKKEFVPEQEEISFNDSLFDEMSRLEEKILKKQFEVEAEDELLYNGFESEIEVAFRKLEVNDVDEELEALKKRLSK